MTLIEGWGPNFDFMRLYSALMQGYPATLFRTEHHYFTTEPATSKPLFDFTPLVANT